MQPVSDLFLVFSIDFDLVDNRESLLVAGNARNCVQEAFVGSLGRVRIGKTNSWKYNGASPSGLVLNSHDEKEGEDVCERERDHAHFK